MVSAVLEVKKLGKFALILLLILSFFGCNTIPKTDKIPGSQVSDTTYPNRTDLTYPDDTDQLITK